MRQTFSLTFLAILLLVPSQAGASLIPFRSSIYGEANAYAGYAKDHDWRLRCPGASSFCPTNALSWEGDATVSVFETGNIGRSDFYSLRRDVVGAFAARVDSGEIKAFTSASVAWDDIYTPFDLRTVAANSYVSVGIEDSVMFVRSSETDTRGLVHFRLSLELDADLSLVGSVGCPNGRARAYGEAIFGNSGSNYLGVNDTRETCPGSAPPNRRLVQEGHFEAGTPFRFQQSLVIWASMDAGLTAWQSSSGTGTALVDAMHTLAPRFEILTPGYTYITSSGFVYDGPDDAPSVPEPTLGALSALGVLAFMTRRRRG